MSVKEKLEADLKTTIDYINNHKEKDAIIDWFVVGPPASTGFSYCSYDTQFKKDMRKLVLDMGWDSSGFGIFMRNIQVVLRKK